MTFQKQGGKVPTRLLCRRELHWGARRGPEIYTCSKLRSMQLPGHFLNRIVHMCCKTGANIDSPGKGGKVQQIVCFPLVRLLVPMKSPGIPQDGPRTHSQWFSTRNWGPPGTPWDVFQALKHKRGGGVGRSHWDKECHEFSGGSPNPQSLGGESW